VSVDRYFQRRYNAKDYNCAHFVCEVWADIKGDDLTIALRGLLCPWSDRRAVIGDLRAIRMLSAPESPCVVYMHSRLRDTHVGIFIRDRVLHLTERSGVQFQPLDVASLGFQRVRFFTC
jgi:hypothetical protein